MVHRGTGQVIALRDNEANKYSSTHPTHPSPTSTSASSAIVYPLHAQGHPANSSFTDDLPWYAHIWSVCIPIMVRCIVTTDCVTPAALPQRGKHPVKRSQCDNCGYSLILWDSLDHPIIGYLLKKAYQSCVAGPIRPSRANFRISFAVVDKLQAPLSTTCTFSLLGTRQPKVCQGGPHP